MLVSGAGALGDGLGDGGGLLATILGDLGDGGLSGLLGSL